MLASSRAAVRLALGKAGASCGFRRSGSGPGSFGRSTIATARQRRSESPLPPGTVHGRAACQVPFGPHPPASTGLPKKAGSVFANPWENCYSHGRGPAGAIGQTARSARRGSSTRCETGTARPEERTHPVATPRAGREPTVVGQRRPKEICAAESERRVGAGCVGTQPHGLFTPAYPMHGGPPTAARSAAFCQEPPIIAKADTNSKS